MSLKLRLALLCFFIAPIAFGQAETIALSPENPKPGETVTFTITVGGCTTVQLTGVNAVGNTIVIDARCFAFTGPMPNVVTGSFTAPPTQGLYQVEFWLNTADLRILTATRQFRVGEVICAFGQSLVADRQSARVGEPVTLSWCLPGALNLHTIHLGSFTIFSSASASGPFTKVGDVTDTQAVLPLTLPGAQYFYVVANLFDFGTPFTPQVSNIVRIDVANATGCLPSAATLCLQNGRFVADAMFRTRDASFSTSAHAVRLTDQSGYFWFFGPDNVEITIKVIDACPAAYWVFASGMTNVRVDISVRERQTGKTRFYSNALGTAFVPMLDTNAFPCP
jgi:hypothetical protein